MERVDFNRFLRKMNLPLDEAGFPRIVAVLSSTTRIKINMVRIGKYDVTAEYVRAGTIGGWNTQKQVWKVGGYYIKEISRTRDKNPYIVITLGKYEEGPQ